jgi:hypothetical protein
MSIKRWVYRDDGKGGVDVIEVGADYDDTPRSTGDLGKFAYDGLRAQDGTPIDTPKRHREYLKKNGLAMMDDFKDHHAKAQEERRRAFTADGYDTKARKQAVVEAIKQLETQGRRRK